MELRQIVIGGMRLKGVQGCGRDAGQYRRPVRVSIDGFRLAHLRSSLALPPRLCYRLRVNAPAQAGPGGRVTVPKEKELKRYAKAFI